MSKLAPDEPHHVLLPVPGLDYGVLEELLGYSLRRAQNALYLDFYRATAEFDVSPQRFAALVLIARNPGLRQQQLAEALGLHRSGALRLADWMGERGWAERHADPSDARAWGLHLTPAGRERLARLTRAVKQHDAALVRALGAGGSALKTELERLARIATDAALAEAPTTRRRS